jgi:hypothetical protein
MKNSLNNTFIKTLLATDFFLVSNKNNNFKHNNSVLKVGKEKIFSLDILSLCKEIKQLIRCLGFLSKNNNADFLIFTKNTQYLSQINSYFSKYPINVKLELFNELFIKYNYNPTIKRKLFLSFTELNSNIINKKLNLNGYNVINQIRLSNKLDLSGSYIIKNIIDSNKKLYFLLSLIETILSLK